MSRSGWHGESRRHSEAASRDKPDIKVYAKYSDVYDRYFYDVTIDGIHKGERFETKKEAEEYKRRWIWEWKQGSKIRRRR